MRCITLRQLQYFQSVVRCGSFSEAAEENFISQSAISQQIQALERSLGFRLLERKNRSFTLTPAGEYFYRKSLALTADYARVCKLGDSVKPGFIVHATTAAYEAAASPPTKPYKVKEVCFAAEKEAVKPQLINPYA